jgi:hypothetical protein
VGEPPVVRLASDPRYPTRHGHGDPLCGQLAHERVEPFPGRFACDRYAAARRRTSFSCSSNRMRLRASRSSAFSLAVEPGVMPSSTSAALIQLVRHDSLIPKSGAICRRCWPVHGCGSRGRRPRGTLWDTAWARVHPSSSALRHHSSDVTCSYISPVRIDLHFLWRGVLRSRPGAEGWTLPTEELLGGPAATSVLCRWVRVSHRPHREGK